MKKVFGLEPPPAPATESFWAATVLLVWVPLSAFAVTLVARWLGTSGPAPPGGLRIFAIALLGTVIWLVRLPAPRIFRLLAVPSVVATILLSVI
jgi:hypothetical protein